MARRILVLAVLAGVLGPGPAIASGSEDPWTAIRKERIRQLLPAAMDRAGVDAWIVVCRENANDPLAEHVGGENAGGTAAFVFLRAAAGVESIAFSPPGEARALAEVGPQDRVVVVERDGLWDRLAALLGERDPQRIAIDSSETTTLADGLSWTQRRALERALGGELSARLVSADDLVAEWLSVKLPEEVAILRRAAALTEQLEVEAYRSVVPGRTTDADVARFLKRRMAELGVEDAWAPDQNPNVNSGVDRGHSHATDRVIQPGDFIQTDFGIKVHGRWCTDIQRFAYVLAPGESAPTPEALERWDKARRGSRAALAAMKPGVRGWDVDHAQREWMRQAGSEWVMWGTGHPVGYWAHDAGPALSGAQRPDPPSAAAQRRLRAGQVFAFDGFFKWKLAGGEGADTKTLSVEEMAVVTEDGAEYLIAPQEELILIPSPARK